MILIGAVSFTNDVIFQTKFGGIVDDGFKRHIGLGENAHGVVCNLNGEPTLGTDADQIVGSEIIGQWMPSIDEHQASLKEGGAINGDGGGVLQTKVAVILNRPKGFIKGSAPRLEITRSCGSGINDGTFLIEQGCQIGIKLEFGFFVVLIERITFDNKFVFDGKRAQVKYANADNNKTHKNDRQTNQRLIGITRVFMNLFVRVGTHLFRSFFSHLSHLLLAHEIRTRVSQSCHINVLVLEHCGRTM